LLLGTTKEDLVFVDEEKKEAQKKNQLKKKRY